MDQTNDSALRGALTEIFMAAVKSADPHEALIGALPEKPVIITLDDGYMTNYTYVLPILKELDMKAEISVIGNAMIYADWGMNWEQV